MMGQIYNIEDYLYLRVFKDIEVYLNVDDHNLDEIMSVAEALGSNSFEPYYYDVVNTRRIVFQDVETYFKEYPNSLTETNYSFEEVSKALQSHDYSELFKLLVREIQYLVDLSWQDVVNVIAIRILYHLAQSLHQIISKPRDVLEQ